MVHSLVNIAEEATVTAHIGQSFVRIATPREATKLAVNVGDTVSLVPLGGNAKGVTTAGLKWNLTRSTLKSFESRGVSNVATSTTVTIYIRTGALAVITIPTESDTQ
jgi:thiamine pyrophosphokinase